MNSHKLWIVAVIMLVCSFAGFTQTVPDLNQGMNPHGSYHGGNLDTVSLSNGNLFFHAALMSYPQRGSGLSYPLDLIYNNKNFTLYKDACLPAPSKSCRYSVVFGPPPTNSGSGVSLGADVTVGFAGLPRVISTPSVGINTGLSFDGNPIFVHTYSVLMPDGSHRPLVNTGSVWMSQDGSGYRYDATSNVLIDGHGTRYNNSLATPVAEDASGNQLSVGSSTTTDTLGRLISASPVPATASTASLTACPALNYSFQPVTFAYTWNLPAPASGGGSITLVLCYASVYVRTALFGSSPVDPGGTGQGLHDLAKGFTMLQSVVYPDNTYWAFQYDAADPNNSASVGFGDLLKVTLPSGGSLTYTYTTSAGCSDPNSGTGSLSRSVLTRTVDANDGTGPHQWTYDTAVTDPLGNDTVHTFTYLNGTCSAYETQTQYFQGSHTGGTLLKTVTTDYTFTVNPYDDDVVTGLATPNTVANVYPIRVTTTLPNGLVSKVETDYDTALTYHGPLDGITSNIKTCPPTDPGGNDNSNCHYFFWGNQITNPVTNYTGSYGKVVAKREYDWGQGAPGPLLRQTTYTYQWQNGTNAASYLSNNFLDLISSTTVYDGAGNQVAKTTYAYDETTPASSSVSTQFDPAPGNGAIRGNQTTASHWLNTSNSMVSSHAAYFDTGELQSSTDPLGHIATHLYDAAYAGAFSTQTCSPATGGGSVTHCVSGTYDFNTGLLTSLTNENATQQASGNSPGDSAHTSTYGYDQYWRLTSALGPPDPANSNLQDTTSFTYSLSPLMVTRQKSITTGLSDTAKAYFDGVGRTFETTHTLPNGTATVITTFDAAGQPSSVTNPYFTTSDPTYGVTQTHYDGLGRVTQTTKQDGSIVTAQYDQPAAVSANGNCTVTADEAGNPHKTCADALGRLIEVDEPGAGANGPGTPGSGTITISGSLQSSTSAGNKATGQFTVNGNEIGVQTWVCNDTCVHGPFVWDSGTVTVYINGTPYSTPYQHGSSANSIAIALAGKITGTPASASNPGAGVTSNLTADQPGPNYSLSTTSSTNDVPDFGGPSFSISLSGSALSNGVYPATTYDSGTVTVTVNGFQASASYGQNLNSDPVTLAGALATALNAAGSPVTAAPNGTSITLTAKTPGQSTNYQVSGSSSVSFIASSTTLSGGTGPGGLYAPLVTLYKYDALGNLYCVEQHGTAASGTACPATPPSPSTPVAPDPTNAWRRRMFAYDSLSRLLWASNPESGIISYAYDNDSNLLQKTSPAPNSAQGAGVTETISYCYDGLHRVLARGYSQSPDAPQQCLTTAPWLPNPAVVYAYDSGANAKGKLTQMTDQAGTATYGYDTLDRLSTETRSLIGANNASISKTVSYEYNLDGSLAKLHYPSGAVVTYTPDSAGRITQAIDNGNSINYITGATYSADNSLTSFIGGSGGAASITNTFTYNKRLQPVTMSAATATQTVFSIGYDFHLGNGDNGNVFGITNYKDANRSQTFGYDGLNRLISAQNAGTDCSKKTLNPNQTEYWGNGYTYDAWGNLLGKTVTKCGAENLVLTPDGHNWIHATGGTDYRYDPAGNMTYDATSGLNYTFDQEDRITGANGYGYIYDGDGNRVEKIAPSTNPTSGTLYWYMTLGVVAESDISGGITSEYIFFDGERVARRDGPYGSGGVFYYFSDHLKTASVITDAAGVIKAESDYYPWGGELQFVNDDSNHYKFTGKEHDGETGLDYMGARYYGSALGRFVTADPKGIALRHLHNPQKLNKYSYVVNNPMSFFDPNGMEEVTITYRTFIPDKQVKVLGTIFRGDNRTFSTKKDASSRTSITIKLETDPKIRPGNPIISVDGKAGGNTGHAGQSAVLDKNGNVVKTDTQTHGLPTATGSRDANGTPIINIQQNTKDPVSDAPQFMTPAVTANINVMVGQDASFTQVTGTASVYPAEELNMTRADGTTTPVMQFQPPSNSPWSLMNSDRDVNDRKDTPACNGGDKGCPK